MSTATDTAKTVGQAVRSLGKDLLGRDYCVTNEVRAAISGDFIMAINSHNPPVVSLVSFVVNRGRA
ncbi:MAG: hypothetical protein PVF51_11495 [Nitrospirota bacterium]